MIEMEKRMQDLTFKSEQTAQCHAAEFDKLKTETETALSIEHALNQTTKAVTDAQITAQSVQQGRRVARLP